MAGKRKTLKELELSGTNIYHPERKNWNTRNDRPLEYKPAPSGYLKRTQIAWHQFMEVKATQGVLSVDDEPLVVAMFDSLDRHLRYKDRRKQLDKELGWTKDDVLVRNHLDIMIDREFKQWTTLAMRFGVGPLDRTKLSVAPKDPEDPMFTLIKKAKEG